MMKTNNIKELERIRTIVCKAWRVDEDKVTLRGRKKEIATARQLIMYFGYFYAACTYNFIGKFLGNRDHTTVMHGARTIQDIIDTDWSFRQQVKEIEKRVKHLPTDEEKIMQYNFEVFSEVKNQL
jgi:chromosomal replication initiator protein